MVSRFLENLFIFQVQYTVPSLLTSSQSYGFSCGHVWMWELDDKESWAPKNWCFWTVVLEKTLESPLDCKEIQPIHPKGYQSWMFIGRTEVEAETPILWPPDAKSWLIGKDSDAGRVWGQEEKGMTENERKEYGLWVSTGVLCSDLEFSSVARLCPALCDPMDCSMPGLSVHH